MTSIYVDSMVTKDTKGLPYRRYTVSYYPTGRRKILLVKNWDGLQWENARRDSFAYDALGNNTALVQKQWQGGQWINLYMHDNAYDANGYRLSDVMEEWQTASASWSPAERDTYAIDANGNTISGASPTAAVVSAYSLAQNFPNPFNPSTTISYSLPSRANVVLNVYDVAGREVARLVNGMMDAGNHTAKLDASGLLSGMYIARLQSGDFAKSIEMILLK